jgi:hypothetical protein
MNNVVMSPGCRDGVDVRTLTASAAGGSLSSLARGGSIRIMRAFVCRKMPGTRSVMMSKLFYDSNLLLEAVFGTEIAKFGCGSNGPFSSTQLLEEADV